MGVVKRAEVILNVSSGFFTPEGSAAATSRGDQAVIIHKDSKQSTFWQGGCLHSTMSRAMTQEMIPIRASVTQINLQESGCSWIEVEIDVPGQCERIELDLEELGPLAYSPPLLNSPQGLRKLWITQDGPPTINVGETILARSFTNGESAE